MGMTLPLLVTKKPGKLVTGFSAVLRTLEGCFHYCYSQSNSFE